MIEPGQIYRQCDPRVVRPTLILIREVGPDRAEITYLTTGQRGPVLGRISLRALHDSPLTRDGKARRTGYALEKQ